jgi:tetratricopeptide (TPR) repeat protein
MRSEEFWDWFETRRALLHSRADTFQKMFEHLDKYDREVYIVETGCTTLDTDDAWKGAGCSSILFDHYIQTHKGKFYSIDRDKEAVATCRKLIKRGEVWWRDSVEALIVMEELRLKIDLLYLDGSDLHWGEPLLAANHHLNELYAALPMLTAESMVAVDDSPVIIDDPRVVIGGKGELVAQHARYNGADIQFCNYQVGWTNMLRKRMDDAGFIELIHRARKYVEEGKHINAEPIYWLIMYLTRDSKSATERVARGEACVFFARLALAKDRPGAAADYYRDALHVDPLATEYRIEFIVKSLRAMGNDKISKQEAIKATRIDPENPETWRTLGGVEHEVNNPKGCIEAYDKQLSLKPDDPDALLDRVTIALDVEDYALVKKLAKKVLNTERRADAIHCLAMVAYREGRHEDAIEMYDEAIELKCHHIHTAHWNKSLALHSIGRYREGWAEHEHRIDEKTNIALSLPLKRFIKPLWTGKEPPSKIHIHCEAGAGDNLAMARYLPLIAQQGHEVTYECPDTMEELLKLSFPDIRVHKRAPDYPGFLGLKPFDYHLPIGSLPFVFKTEVDTVPWYGPYLKANPEKVGKYEAKFPGGPRIGLVWSAGVRRGLGIWLETYGERKSMTFNQLSRIVDEGSNFVSLQVGPEREENDGTVMDLLPREPLWEDTAALVECLDLVITVDTSVAHLAGAMGKPVWVMMHTEGSWHWMAERPGASWNTKSPWYPSARIFRCKKGGEWEPVIQRVVKELEALEQRKVA